MKRYKKEILALEIFPLIIILYGLYVDFVRDSYVRLIQDGIETFLALFSLIMFFLLLILFFLKEPIYKSWRKFAIMFLPIAVILIMITPEHSSSFLGGLSFGYEREGVSILLSALFSISSLVLIIWKSVKLLKK